MTTDSLIAELQAAIVGILGERLVGLYVYGSLAAGDFDPHVSDIDILAVTSGPLSWLFVGQLKRMHAAFAMAHPEWRDRIEVQYIPAQMAAAPDRPGGLMAGLRPGHDFATIAGADRLLDLYCVRQTGLVLMGPPPSELIPEIRSEQLRAHNLAELEEWPEYVKAARDLGFQAHLVLTICRKLYTTREGTITSKARAAAWVAASYPPEARRIRQAMAWRQGEIQGVDEAAEYADTIAFVERMTAEIRAN